MTDTNTSSGNRFWTFLRILNVRLRFIFLMVIVGVVVGYWENITNYYDRWQRPISSKASEAAQDIEYYCPMHPQVIRATMDNCPICGMPLSKRARSEQAALPEGILSRVHLTPYKLQMGRIGTSTVSYQLLGREIRTVGIVDYDETRRAFIAARIKGRIDKLFVNFVGQQVEKGAPLASIYSPDLLIAQEELLTAVRNVRSRPGAAPATPERPAGSASEDFAVTAAQSMVEAARKKLILWGITPEQVDDIIQRGQPQTNLTIASPITGIVTQKDVLEGRYVDEGADLYTIADLSRVWMEAKIFEDEIEGVKLGTAVEVRSTASPDELFAGRIDFIAYTVDPQTRTVSARVEVDNPDYKLKPGMYASAVIRLPAGEVHEVTATAPAIEVTSAPSFVKEDDSVHEHAASAPAAGVASDTLLHAYLNLASAFASDKTDDMAARDLAKQAAALGQTAPETQRARARAIADAAGMLPGKDLRTQRKMFAPLSAKMIELVKALPPRERSVSVANCPMVKADWLQTDKSLRNPYYGSEMLECGEIIETIRAVGNTAQNVRFVQGYYCPITPTRLYDKPEHCPVDKFPMKLVRVEKVLAIPSSALVDTGTRKVAYRESAPGTFDLIEVKVGIRAGEFYPVLSGLQDGDRVATAGAFLVDAENRLNPAAGAQFFGATEVTK